MIVIDVNVFLFTFVYYLHHLLHMLHLLFLQNQSSSDNSDRAARTVRQLLAKHQENVNQAHTAPSNSVQQENTSKLLSSKDHESGQTGGQIGRIGNTGMRPATTTTNNDANTNGPPQNATSSFSYLNRVSC